jgi:hypothetical protein
MTGITTYPSILTMNVNRLNSPIKGHQTGLKNNIQQPVVYRRPTDRNKHWLRVKGWEKIYQANGPPKQYLSQTK